MADFDEAGKGASLRTLTGQENYSSWVRDFKVLATEKGVFGLYTGEMQILAKPDKNTFLYPNGGDRASRKKTDEFDFTAAAAEYRIELEEYKDNEKLVRVASALLGRQVDPAIRGNIMSCATPKDAWELSQSLVQDDRQASP